jgi:hypothetical protein
MPGFAVKSAVLLVGNAETFGVHSFTTYKVR